MRSSVRPHLLAPLGAAGLVVGCLVGGLPSVAHAEQGRAGGTSPAAATPSASGRWALMAPSGLPAPKKVTGAWTGRELLVVADVTADSSQQWQGYAAAYSPSARAWRRLASPLPRPLGSSDDVQSVWTGRELVVAGAILEAYNPSTNRWRVLPSMPARFGPSGSVLAWTGREVIGWGGGGGAESLSTGSSYDPRTNRWTALPRSPLSGRHAAAVWTGRELVVVGGRALDPGFHNGYFRDAAAYNPRSRTWRRLPAMPAPRAGAAVVWTGREVFVVGGSAAPQRPVARSAFAYSPVANRWRAVATPALPAGDLTGAWTGSRILLWSGGAESGERIVAGGGVEYSLSTGRWTALPVSGLRPRIFGVAAWTGRELLAWGGLKASDGASYRPAS